MNARVAPAYGAVLGLALFGAGSGHALSLRGSAAELFLGDVLPGTSVAGSKAGARLRVENSGSETVKLAFKAVSPPLQDLKDGWEPWPSPDRVRVDSLRTTLAAGEGADVEVAVRVPDEADLSGGQYQFDVLETGTDPAGASLTVKTRVLLSVGAPLPRADVSAEGFAPRPGFTLAPPSAALDGVPLGRTDAHPGAEATLKLVNAGDEDLTVTLSPAREWDDEARIKEGYEPAPNPRWLRFDPGVVVVRAGAIVRARIWADVPRQARYAGRRWAFVAAVDAEASGRRTRRYFTLNVTTEKMEEKTQAP